jgi:hypothetical protein
VVIAITTESWVEFFAFLGVVGTVAYLGWRALRSSRGDAAMGRVVARRDLIWGAGAVVACIVGVALLSWSGSQQPVQEIGGTWFAADGKQAVSPTVYDGVRIFAWLVLIGGVGAFVLGIVRYGGNPLTSAARTRPATGVGLSQRSRSDSSQLPPPGWLSDPDDQTVERWWDGTAWGTQTRPAPSTMSGQ